MLISKFNNSNIEIEVKELEETYNIVLPEVYKKFIYKYNGGRTPETEFRLNRVSSDIEGFYGFGNADPDYHVDCLKSSPKWNEWMRSKMFPIATNVFGDYIMISVDGESRGRIYFCYHDKPLKFIELAEDFLSFTQKCKSKKIGHIRSLEERKNDMIRLGKTDRITPERIAGWQAEIDEYKNIQQEELSID